MVSLVAELLRLLLLLGLASRKWVDGGSLLRLLLLGLASHHTWHAHSWLGGAHTHLLLLLLLHGAISCTRHSSTGDKASLLLHGLLLALLLLLDQSHDSLGAVLGRHLHHHLLLLGGQHLHQLRKRGQERS